jgi:hypothetical protein
MFYMWRGRKERMYLHMKRKKGKNVFTYEDEEVERKEYFYI